MKKILLAIVCLLSLTLQAQSNNDRPKVEEMHERKWQYIVDRAQLSEKDAALAEPIFKEYEQSVWKLMEKNKPVFIKNKKQSDQKPNFEELNDKYVNVEIQKAQLLKAYYLKLKKVVSAETIFNMSKAERSFRNELIRDWQKRKPMQNK